MILISVISILILCVVIERTTHVVIAPVRKLTNVIQGDDGRRLYRIGQEQRQ